MTVGDPDVDAAFRAVAERRSAQAENVAARRSLWRTHHWPDRYDRCAVVAGRHVCRRCAWFYGVSFGVMAVGFAGLSPWPRSLDVWLVWILSIPATLEFICGELGWCRYNSRRQVAATVVLAAAVGRGFYVELSEGGSWLFWGPVLFFGPIWFIAAVVGWIGNTGQYHAVGPHALGSDPKVLG